MQWKLDTTVLLKYVLPNHLQIIARNVVNLSFKIIGESSTDPDKSPVMLFHGLLGNKRHWDGLGKTIMNMTKRNVVSVDLRNHGDSPHVSSHNYKELAKDVIQLFDKMDIDRASLIGHSMGGRTSMYVSLMKPKIVASLLVLDISPVSTTSQLTRMFPPVMKAMKEIDFTAAKNVNDARREAKKKLSHVISDDITMNAVLSNINKKSDGTVGWICNLDVLIKDFKHIATFPKTDGKAYPGPTLFIGGQLSEFLPPDDLPSIRTLFPQAVITYVPKTGHNLHAEDPKSFLELAIDFLKTVE